MCTDCWEGHGSPADWNPHVERAVTLINTICTEETTGGPLHSLISNWNIDGVIGPGDVDEFSPEVAQAARELAALFNAMPVRERAAALAYANGYAAAPTPSDDQTRRT